MSRGMKTRTRARTLPARASPATGAYTRPPSSSTSAIFVTETTQYTQHTLQKVLTLCREVDKCNPCPASSSRRACKVSLVVRAPPAASAAAAAASSASVACTIGGGGAGLAAAAAAERWTGTSSRKEELAPQRPVCSTLPEGHSWRRRGRRWGRRRPWTLTPTRTTVKHQCSRLDGKEQP